MRYRKIGGMHWVSIGRWRVAVCRTQRQEYIPSPNALPALIAVGLYLVLWFSYWGV